MSSKILSNSLTYDGLVQFGVELMSHLRNSLTSVVSN